MTTTDFEQGYRLGWANGADVAWLQGYNECAADVSLRLGAASTLLKATRPFREVEAQRAKPIEGCQSPRCRPGPRCSACVRAAAARRNLASYGAPDRPGDGG